MRLRKPEFIVIIKGNGHIIAILDITVFHRQDRFTDIIHDLGICT